MTIVGELLPSTPAPPPPHRTYNKLPNGNFETVVSNQPSGWNKGCSGTARSTIDSHTGYKAYALNDGACVSRTFNYSSNRPIAGLPYSYSCYAKNTSGYATMSIFLLATGTKDLSRRRVKL